MEPKLIAKLDGLMEMFTSNGGAESDAAPLREFLWDNKDGILRELQRREGTYERAFLLMLDVLEARVARESPRYEPTPIVAGDEHRDGWGVIDRDGLDLRTVGPTRRSAIVNWLVIEGRQRILNSHSDQQIDVLWAMHRGGAMASPVRCTVVRG